MSATRCLLLLSLAFFGRIHCLFTRCLLADPDGACQVCADGYFARHGGCVPQRNPQCLEYEPNTNRCKQFKDSVVSRRRLQSANCQVVDNNVCKLCPSLFRPSPNPPAACLPITSGNCVTSNGAADACATCASGYYPLNGQCTAQSKPNCLTYRPNTNMCTSCQGTFLAIAGFCVASNAPNCLNYNSATNICGRCDTDYLNSNGGCIYAFDINCSTKTALGVLCGTCNSGYYPDPVQKKCVPQGLPNCLSFSPNTNQCTSCSGDLVVVGNSCVPFSLPNCVTAVKATGRCTLCQTSYYISSSTGLCLPTSDSHCGSSDGLTDVCLTCANLYYKPLGRSCTPIDDVNCLVNRPNQNLCNQCREPYVPSLGICVCNGTTACQAPSLTNPARCAVCSIGCAVNNQGNCQNNPVLYCLDYSFQTGLCYRCTDPRILNPCTNTCVLSVTPETPTIPNCLAQCGSQCKNCAPGFVPASSGLSCDARSNYVLQIAESRLYLVLGADTSPANHAATTSSIVSAANTVRVSVSGPGILIQAVGYAGSLNRVVSGQVTVTPSASSAVWTFTPVPNTIGYFRLRHQGSGETLSSWTTTGSPATVKFIPN